MARLFVSDVHLEEAAAEATEQFLRFLRDEASGAEALYILGDLFEAWIGDDDQAPGNERVCRALHELTRRGVACFALHGNRDFLLGGGFAARSGCQLLPDPVLAEFDGEALLLTHGDALCSDDHSYQELRTMVRDPRWQQRFLALPREQRELLAHAARAGSRRHTARTVPRIMDVNGEAVLAAFRSAQVRRMVHGHTHRPGIHDLEVDGRSAQRIVLGAWHEQGSYLRYEHGRYQLHTLPR